jgi:hypothetical protein
LAPRPQGSSGADSVAGLEPGGSAEGSSRRGDDRLIERANPAVMPGVPDRALAAPAQAGAVGGHSFARTVVGCVLRVAAVNAALITLYWLTPFNQRFHGRAVAGLTFAVLVLVLVTVWELRTITRSSHPELRAVEAVGVSLPIALLPFAATYYAMSSQVAGSFAAHLTRLDALYFTLTTFSTVGYGDIAPKSEAARAVTMAQMVVDLVMIGLIAKVILGAARRRRESLEVGSGR